ncbi:MAG TPA: NAD-dependent epimerase/dehydratase family protein [Chloroflexaceae bacterium]|mgnify:CR=1 FL=1|nr:NAD-dependent epimerase/dehydratase family protein [Chloroflexaceae bacterium]
MKVFLTGGTGFIGQQLTKAFLARGWSVVALVRRPDSPQARALTRMGAQCVPGDVTGRETMRVGMTGADVVVHAAGYYELGIDRAGVERMQAINITGTEHVLSLAHELRVPRTIYVSTVQAFGDTALQERDETFIRQAPCRTTYEQSKTDAHGIAGQYQHRGLPLIIVCPNVVVGRNDHAMLGYFLRLYLNRVLPPMAFSPDTILGCVYVDDLAEGIALAAERGRMGETYVLGGESLSVREHLEFWSMRPGAFRPLLWLPAKGAALLFAPLEPLQRMLKLPAFLSREAVMGSTVNMCFSTNKAKRELGWTHRSTEAMWSATIDGELELLARRRGQSLIQRLRPMDTVD